MNTLSELKIRNAKPQAKPYKLADSNGLYLLVNQTGKYWRWNYRFLGKQKTLALGVYPETSLSAARAALAEARRQLSEGIDPGAARKQAKQQQQAMLERAAHSFEAVALEWHTQQADSWTDSWTASHAKLVLRMLKRHLLPTLGDKPKLSTDSFYFWT